MGRTYILNDVLGTQQIFFKEKKSFISYSNNDFGIEYRLSDGSQLGLENEFQNVTYQNTYDFYGVIDWSRNNNLTYKHASKWIFNLTASNDFKYIESGTMKAIDVNGTEILS